MLQNKKKLEARGDPSLQNVLNLARSGLSYAVSLSAALLRVLILRSSRPVPRFASPSPPDSHLPPHGSREVIIILGSLTTCDPGNIHSTIRDVEKDRIRVNIIGLSAEMKICRDIATQTKGELGLHRLES